MSDIVILDPQFLTNVMAAVVRVLLIDDWKRGP